MIHPPYFKNVFTGTLSLILNYNIGCKISKNYLYITRFYIIVAAFFVYFLTIFKKRCSILFNTSLHLACVGFMPYKHIAE